MNFRPVEEHEVEEKNGGSPRDAEIGGKPPGTVRWLLWFSLAIAVLVLASGGIRGSKLYSVNGRDSLAVLTDSRIIGTVLYTRPVIVAMQQNDIADDPAVDVRDADGGFRVKPLPDEPATVTDTGPIWRRLLRYRPSLQATIAFLAAGYIGYNT